MARVYIISYDLAGTDQTQNNYTSIITDIDNMADIDHIRIQKSVHIVITDTLTTLKIKTALRGYITDKDSLLFICQLTKSATGKGYTANEQKALRKYFPNGSFV